MQNKKEIEKEDIKNGACPHFLFLPPLLTWIIHGSSLPDCHAPLATTMLFKIYVRRMRGTGYAAVVLNRKSPVTKQTSLRGAKRRGNLMSLANHHEIATLCSR
jgi:hypothetical protein